MISANQIKIILALCLFLLTSRTEARLSGRVLKIEDAPNGAHTVGLYEVSNSRKNNKGGSVARKLKKGEDNGKKVKKQKKTKAPTIALTRIEATFTSTEELTEREVNEILLMAAVNAVADSSSNRRLELGCNELDLTSVPDGTLSGVLLDCDSNACTCYNSGTVPSPNEYGLTLASTATATSGASGNRLLASGTSFDTELNIYQEKKPDVLYGNSIQNTVESEVDGNFDVTEEDNANINVNQVTPAPTNAPTSAPSVAGSV